jgi:hypothetical protein
MTALDALSELHRVGARLTVDGDRLRCAAPFGVLTAELRVALSERKEELILLLPGGSAVGGSPPGPVLPQASSFYSALNKSVATPLGPGRLWQAFSSRVGVVLDSNPSRVTFFDPAQIRSHSEYRD